MYRHDKKELKSGETRMRFRCQTCMRFESYYQAKGGDEWLPEYRKAGRPQVDDVMFRWAWYGTQVAA